MRFLYLPLPVADFAREKPPELQSVAPFRGFSITRPWKRAAASAGVPSDDVRATGAANTLVAHRGRWRAENTDVDGVFDPLADHDTGEGRSAVVLGAGGTARAAVVAARRLGYDVVIASRRDEAADALGAELKVDAVAWSDVPATEADLYVNTTPVGMAEGDGSAVPERVLENRPLVFDCVYRRSGETATVAAARRARCPVIDGLSMFAVQALRQARLFGVGDAGTEEVRKILSGGRIVSAKREAERLAFAARAAGGRATPVARVFPADALTPVTLFRRMRASGSECFLLESVEGGEAIARYTFLGCEPVARLTARDGRNRDRRGVRPASCGAGLPRGARGWRRGPVSSPIRTCRRSRREPSAFSGTTPSASWKTSRTGTRAKEGFPTRSSSGSTRSPPSITLASSSSS